MKLSEEEYKKLIQDRVEGINKEIEELKQRQAEARNVSLSLESRIIGLTAEKKELEKQLINYTGMSFSDSKLEKRINDLDDRYKNNEDRKVVFQNKKNELETMKNAATTKYAKNRIQKRIDKLEHSFEKLQKKGARIQGLQRRMIMPKFRKENLKRRIIDRQFGRVSEYQDRMIANEELRDSLKDKVFGRFTSKIYDMKAKHYKRRYDRSLEVLTNMQNKNSLIGIQGARVAVIGKRAVDGFRKRCPKPAPVPTPTPTPAPTM